MGQTTITVERETLKRFNSLKEDASEDHMPEHSADLFLQILMDTYEAAGDGHYSERDETLEVIKEQLEQLDVEQTTLDDEHIVKTIKNRIDDLENRLPKKVSEELR